MVVLTQAKHSVHSGAVGLHVGAENVQEHFPRDMGYVELELDHLNIVCTLDPSFWADHPEIHDMRLSLWLEAKRSSGKLSAQGAPVSLIPSGTHKFRIELTVAAEPVELPQPLPVRKIDPEVLDTHVAALLPVLVPSLDRRKHGAVHAPERRRVGRLKSDEPTSIAANH